MGDQNGDNNQYHYCYYCLHGFTKKKLLEKHLPYCQVHGAQRTEMPSEDEKWLKFSDVSKQLSAVSSVRRFQMHLREAIRMPTGHQQVVHH